MVEAIVEYNYTAENDDELTITTGDIITNVIQQGGGWWEGELNGHHGLFPDNFVRVLKEKPKRISLHQDIQDKRNSLEKMLADGVIRRSDQGNKRRRAKVVYSYTPSNDDELKLEVDDVLEVIEQDEEGWFRGLLNGREGVFPSNFVKVFDEDEEILNKEKGAEEESQMVRPKKVKGVGLGNIFVGGPIHLKSKPVTVSESTPSIQKPPGPPKKPPPPAPSAVPPKAVTKEYACVLYPYEADNNDELTLKEGDLVAIVSKDIEDKGWWKGELNGKIGVFPDNFVELITYEEAKSRKLLNLSGDSSASSSNKTVEKSSDGTKSEKCLESVSNTSSPNKTVTKVNEVSRSEKLPDLLKTEKVTESSKSELTKPEKPPDPPKCEKSLEINKEKIQEHSKPDKPPPPELPKTLPQLDINKTNEAIKRIPPELPKKDVKVLDKIERPIAPPIPTKKPQLPPPIKKPLKVPTTTSTIIPPSLTTNSTLSSEETEEHMNENKIDFKDRPDNSDDFDSIESTEKLTHLTANRAKNPNRRPPSHIFMKENEKDENTSEPIWMKELKKNQVKRISQNIPDSKSKDASPEEVPMQKTRPFVLAMKNDEAIDINERSKSEEFVHMTNLELQEEIKSLKEMVSSLRSEFDRKLLDLMAEIDEEKKTRLTMTVELERLKKLVKS